MNAEGGLRYSWLGSISYALVVAKWSTDGVQQIIFSVSDDTENARLTLCSLVGWLLCRGMTNKVLARASPVTQIFLRICLEVCNRRDQAANAGTMFGILIEAEAHGVEQRFCVLSN